MVSATMFGVDHGMVLRGPRVGPGGDGPHPRLGWALQGQLAGGRMTLSMTWMTPLEAITSGVTTFALSFR